MPSGVHGTRVQSEAINIKVDPETKSMLKALAEIDGRGQSAVLRELIQRSYKARAASRERRR